MSLTIFREFLSEAGMMKLKQERLTALKIIKIEKILSKHF